MNEMVYRSGYCPYLEQETTIMVEYTEYDVAGGGRIFKKMGFKCDNNRKCPYPLKGGCTLEAGAPEILM